MSGLETHFEEFLHLAGLGHDKALIAWGGFYFRRGDSPYGEWRIVDDEELAAVAPTPRSETIGAGSEPFGPGLFYRFQVGANVEFICLDTSIASDMDVEHYFDDPAHRRWVGDVLGGEGVRRPGTSWSGTPMSAAWSSRRSPACATTGRWRRSTSDPQGRPAEPTIRIAR